MEKMKVLEEVLSKVSTALTVTWHCGNKESVGTCNVNFSPDCKLYEGRQLSASPRVKVTMPIERYFAQSRSSKYSVEKTV